MELSQERLEMLLAPRPVRFYPQVRSTQDAALGWLRDGAEAGSVVVADEQIAGRGRQSRTWHTPPGVALAVSVILHPAVDVLPQVTMLGGFAVAEVIDSLGASGVTIKWPNDVRLKGYKISGVLPEAVWDGDRLLGVVLGMGVNVRVDFSGTALEGVAASIEPVLGIQIDRATLIVDLVERVDYWTARLGTSELFEAWKSRLETLGQKVTVMHQDHPVSGVVDGVDRQGRLLVRDATGSLHRVVAGDVIDRN